MEYTVEDLSPVKKKVAITTDPKEVEAAIMGAVALYKTSVQIDGFRKGKVPASVIEQRFRDRIYEEARQDLVNEVMSKLDVTPVSGINMVDGEPVMERGKGMNYSIEFEVLPTFDLPPYEGMEVEQEKTIVDDAEVEEVVERIRRDRAKLVPVDGDGPAVDGQVANIDFCAYENGQPLEGIKADGFDLALGEKQALEDFENLVKTIKLGCEAEGDITFPEDFLAKDLAGKTVTMKVKVHAIKERQLPAVDDELAKAVGVENVEKLKAGIRESYRSSRYNLNKGSAQKSMLDKLVKMVEFELPPSMVDVQARTLLADMRARMERQGKSLDSLGKTEEELLKEVQPQAEEITRMQVLLLAIAAKAKAAKRVNTALVEPADSEMKYFCRAFLLQLGLGGAEHRDMRSLLLNHLHGYAAFRTTEKMDAHRQKYADLRRQLRESDSEAQSEVTEHEKA